MLAHNPADEVFIGRDDRLARPGGPREHAARALVVGIRQQHHVAGGEQLLFLPGRDVAVHQAGAALRPQGFKLPGQRFAPGPQAGTEQDEIAGRGQLQHGLRHQLQALAFVAAAVKQKNQLVRRQVKRFPRRRAVGVKIFRIGVGEQMHRRPGISFQRLVIQRRVQQQQRIEPVVTHEPAKTELFEQLVGRPAGAGQKLRAQPDAPQPPAQTGRGQPAKRGAAQDGRGNVVEMRQKGERRARLLQADGHAVRRRVEFAGRVGNRRHDVHLRQQVRHLIFDAFQCVRPGVHRQRQAQPGPQQILGEEPQPADMVAVHGGLVNQDMTLVPGHGHVGGFSFCA